MFLFFVCLFVFLIKNYNLTIHGICHIMLSDAGSVSEHVGDRLEVDQTDT